MDNKGAKGKQSNKQKRDRAPSGKTTSPSEKQTQKKLKTLEFVDHSDTDSTYDILDFSYYYLSWYHFTIQFFFILYTLF